MDALTALDAVARRLGVLTAYTDGLCRDVTVGSDTVVAVCAALGAPLRSVEDAPAALAAIDDASRRRRTPLVRVAWDGRLAPLGCGDAAPQQWDLELEDGAAVPVTWDGQHLVAPDALPPGYHRLRIDVAGDVEEVAIIAAPVQAYRRPGAQHSWGVGTQLAALRTRRSRSLGDLADLEALCGWVGRHGGDLVTVLPLLPVFTDGEPEPSPYAPVSRLFWSELILDLGEAHRPAASGDSLDVRRAADEVRAALAGRSVPDDASVDDELRRYAMFRGAQRRHGRNWRDWPEPLRRGALSDAAIDADEARFHLAAQLEARHQLGTLRRRLDEHGMRLGLDLAVGAHPDGYDTWSRQPLFSDTMSVGAPPDLGFPSGQDWGFRPVLPEASRAEGHRYLAASLRHQMALAGVLRIDHVMALARLYWIPQGFGLDQGTYVRYPAEELFAIVTLESTRHRCEVVGENLGTVPEEIDAALPRHRIRGMYLAQFAALSEKPIVPPGSDDVALIGTHDTPTLRGWMAAHDVDDRLRHDLLAAGRETAVREERAWAVQRLAELLGVSPDDPAAMLEALLEWLGRSASPLVIPWLEDFWLEARGVNLPGTTSAARENWQRPLAGFLDDLLRQPEVESRAARLQAARQSAAPASPSSHSRPRVAP